MISMISRVPVSSRLMVLIYGLELWLICLILPDLSFLLDPICLLSVEVSHLWNIPWRSQVAQSCPTLCESMDCSLPGSIHEIFQARILEWVAISFSRGSSRLREDTLPSEPPGKPLPYDYITIWPSSFIPRYMPVTTGQILYDSAYMKY